jgi:hypothetical protein
MPCLASSLLAGIGMVVVVYNYAFCVVRFGLACLGDWGVKRLIV